MRNRPAKEKRDTSDGRQSQKTQRREDAKMAHVEQYANAQDGIPNKNGKAV